MESLTRFVTEFERFMYSPWFVVTLLGTGVLLTIRTRFIQFRKMGMAMRLVLDGALHRNQGQGQQGDITPFQALSTALAATVGLGNIAGVATALALGGPGAIFWMWMTALFGMATIYGEAMLAIKFREVKEDGSMAGGPMYYIRRGLNESPIGRGLGTAFALTGTIACFLSTGNMMQSNSIALSFNSSFGVPFWITGLGLAFITGLVIIGGIKRIGVVVEQMVPFMIVFYVGAGLVVLLLRITHIPESLALIMRGAFQPMAPVGGFAGAGVIMAMQYGVSRGILSNEAGLGSSPIAHGAAKEEDPDRQGLMAMNGVFIDTIVVCTMTALVILVTGVWDSGLTSTELTSAAFDSVFSKPYGSLIVTFSALLFGFTTLIGWSYYGEKCAQYLMGDRVVIPYRYIFVTVAFIGAVIKLDLVWSIGTIANACMALPNLLGLIALSGVVGGIAGERPGSIRRPRERNIPGGKRYPETMLPVIRIFYAIALVLYGASAAGHLRAYRCGAPPGAGRRLALLGYGLLFQSLGLVMYTIYLRQAPFLGMFQGYTFAGFTLALLYLLIFRRAEGEASYGLIVVPLVCLFSLVGLFTPLERVHDPLLAPNPLFILHASAALVSYGAFGIAFAAAVLYLVLHREIKSKRLGRVFRKLPPLGELDHLTYLAVTIGFIALTLAIAFGMAWSQVRLGKPLQLDAKEIITLADWLVFAFYLHSRSHGAWKGKRAAWLAIAGFSLAVFNFVIVTVVLSRTHSFL